MEKQFLMYIMYATFIELRLSAYENSDQKSINLCNLLHTIPLILIEDDTGKLGYQALLEKLEVRDMNSWLSNRKKEFKARFPELHIDSL
jgi:hypothetical protein